MLVPEPLTLSLFRTCYILFWCPFSTLLIVELLTDLMFLKTDLHQSNGIIWNPLLQYSETQYNVMKYMDVYIYFLYCKYNKYINIVQYKTELVDRCLIPPLLRFT